MTNWLRPTLATCIGISSAMFGASSFAADFSQAIVAAGPAGTLATEVYSPYYGYALDMLVDAKLYGGTQATQYFDYKTAALNGSLVSSMKAQFGPVDTGQIRNDISHPIPMINLDSVHAYGRPYVAPLNADQTSLTFTFSGIAPTADTITATLYLNDANAHAVTQSATWEGQGDWSLTLTAPTGFNVDFFHLYLSSTSLATVQSFALGLNVASVPEASSFAMMAIGMLSLLGARQRRLTK